MHEADPQENKVKALRIILLALVFTAFQANADDERNLAVKQVNNAVSEQRIALVIGNGAYTSSPLKNPVNDAKDMAKKLRGLGFDVIERSNMQTKQIGATLREFRSKLVPGAVALVFYAGHGLQIKGINYLPAVDADINSEEDVPNQSLGVNQIMDVLDESKTRLNLVFLDACRNNPYARSFRSADKGLARVSAPSGTLISYATRPGSIAADGNGRNGLYTSKLLAQMDSNLQIEQTLKRVVTAVKAASQGKQEPWMEGSIEGDFCFAGCAAGGTQVTSLVPVPVHVKTKEEIEQDAWDSVRDSGSISSIQEYLKQYPKGRFAGQARILITSLKNAPSKPAEPTASPAREDNETALWTEAQKGNSKDDYDAYLAQYPKGKYVALARSRIKKLQDEAANEASRKEQGAWEAADKSGSEDGYQGYLKGWPSGKYASLAQARLRKLQSDLAAQTALRNTIKEIFELAKKGDSAKLEELKELAGKGNADAQGYLARIYFNGWGVKKDYAEGLIWARKAAEQGNSDGQSALGASLVYGFGAAKDETEGVKWYRKAAEQGNAKAQINLGWAYTNGRGVAKDESEAAKWFRKAYIQNLAVAEQGDAEAQANLGRAYANGQGIAKDEAEAVKWFRKAAEQGNAAGQASLGQAYANGQGVAKDEAEAVKWYRKAAEQGDVDAQNNLGVMYTNGQGVAKDEAEAVKWYRKATEQGDAYGQYNLGLAYGNGRGVAKDEAEAVKWYRKAAEQENAGAQINLGWAYENGRGVVKDEAEAIKWYRKAAEQGHAVGQANLGRAYDHGRGVAKDEVEAVKWYRKAAEQGDAGGQNNLGSAYANGQGVAKDEAEAVKWHRKAAEQGDVNGQYNLGRAYASGLGVAEDKAEALKWYRKAAEQGHAKAINILKNISR
ncbi:MAG: caspase family protein [Gallionella sp.]|nr:caspase family protein [Gallionella sp.]